MNDKVEKSPNTKETRTFHKQIRKHLVDSCGHRCYPSTMRKRERTETMESHSSQKRCKSSITTTSSQHPCKGSKYCSYHSSVCNQNNHGGNFNQKFYYLPDHPKVCDQSASLEKRWKAHATKCLRGECLRRLGFEQYHIKKVQFCNFHKLEDITRRLTITHNGKSMSRTYQFTVPIHYRTLLQNQRHVACMLHHQRGVGVGIDLLFQQNVKKEKSVSERTVLGSMMHKLLHDVLEDEDKLLIYKFNPFAGNGDMVECKQNTEPRKLKRVKCIPVCEPKKFLRPPVHTPLNMSDNIIKDETGFSSLHSLLSYTAVLCNGDFQKMTNKKKV